MSLGFENIYDGTNNNVQENELFAGEIKTNLLIENAEKKILTESTNLFNNINPDALSHIFKHIPKKLDDEPIKEDTKLENDGLIKEDTQLEDRCQIEEISQNLEENELIKEVPQLEVNSQIEEKAQTLEDPEISKEKKNEKIEDDATPGPSTSNKFFEKNLRRRVISKPYFTTFRDFPILKNKPKSLNSLTKLGAKNRSILFNLFTQLSSYPCVKLRRIDEYLNK